jgi:Neuraminidase (sialidase)
MGINMPQAIFNGENGYKWRIPSLVNAGGALVAAACNNRTGADWGYIELAVRISRDMGESWEDVKTIASPPARVINEDINNTRTAFFIDPCMTVTKSGRIVMLVTFFPESKGIHDKKRLEPKKSAYTSFDRVNCPVVYDRDDNYYIIMPNGAVIDRARAKTAYTVGGLGDLYKGDEYVGNIFLNGAKGRGEGRTTFGAPLKAPKRSYVFMLKSDDSGESWSEPVDITGMITDERDGAFAGVAPGTGLTTESGRLIFPLYTEKGTICIYSDDDGITWHRNPNSQYTGNKGEWTAAEIDETIYAFGRDKGKVPCTVSYDNGITWQKGEKNPIKAPFCQKNALLLGDRLLISHPSGKERENGVISVGDLSYGKHGNFKGISWRKEEISINSGHFAYSCMARLDDNTVAVLYEDSPSGSIVLDKFSI